VKIIYPVKEEKDLPPPARLRPSSPLRLARTRPEYAGLRQEEILRVLGDADAKDHPVSQEVARLAGLYLPRLKEPVRAIRPAGLLRLDVRAPIEKVAADLAFRMVSPAAHRPA
jgi:hypothetical protein